MMKRITINDIAKKLGITPSTVSRALDGNTRISTKTRELVLATAKDMGYQQNKLASSLRKGTSATIGMVVPRINRHFFSNVISGVEEILNPAGYTLLLSQSGENFIKEKNAVDMLLAHHVGGIIISLSVQTQSYQHLEYALARGVPIVQFDRINHDLKSSKVINDNFTGAYLATKHLIKNGYKRIGHFTGSLHLDAYHQRYLGFTKALHESGLPINEQYIYKDTITREAGHTAILDILKKEDKPDAIFCAGDYAALGVLDGLKEMTIKVPQEFGVAGFANEPFSELMHPNLTTVEQNAFEMGTRVAQEMIKNLQGKPNLEPITIPTRLIVRDSSWRR